MNLIIIYQFFSFFALKTHMYVHTTHTQSPSLQLQLTCTNLEDWHIWCQETSTGTKLAMCLCAFKKAKVAHPAVNADITAGKLTWNGENRANEWVRSFFNRRPNMEVWTLVNQSRQTGAEAGECEPVQTPRLSINPIWHQHAGLYENKCQLSRQGQYNLS